MPHLLEATDAKCQWTTKVCALRALGELSKNAPKQVAAAVPDIIPAASYAVSDAKPQVRVFFFVEFFFLPFLPLLDDDDDDAVDDR